MNVPGIYTIDYLQSSHIELPFLTLGSKVKISDYTNENPKPINFIPGSSQLLINKISNQIVEIFDLKLSFLIAGNDPDQMNELDIMDQVRHIFIVMDNSLTKYLIGSNKGARPSVSYEIINEPKQRCLKCMISFSTALFPILVID